MPVSTPYGLHHTPSLFDAEIGIHRPRIHGNPLLTAERAESAPFPLPLVTPRGPFDGNRGGLPGLRPAAIDGEKILNGVNHAKTNSGETKCAPCR